MATDNIEPFYFGPPGKRLFGCLHHPPANLRRDCSVVICSPWGHEYIQFHRACRQMAILLSRACFPVLRFDFYGCGDSQGDREGGSLRLWLCDIKAAIAEAQKRSETSKVCLIGIRLGGSLAAIACNSQSQISALVLWDVVVDGSAYLEELFVLHRRMMRQAHVKAGCQNAAMERTERLGFPITDNLASELSNLDLLTLGNQSAQNILLIESHPTVCQDRLSEHLSSFHQNVTFRHQTAPRLWRWMEDIAKVLVPLEILQTIVSWTSKVSP